MIFDRIGNLVYVLTKDFSKVFNGSQLLFIGSQWYSMELDGSRWYCRLIYGIQWYCRLSAILTSAGPLKNHYPWNIHVPSVKNHSPPKRSENLWAPLLKVVAEENEDAEEHCEGDGDDHQQARVDHSWRMSNVVSSFIENFKQLSMCFNGVTWTILRLAVQEVLVGGW